MGAERLRRSRSPGRALGARAEPRPRGSSAGLFEEVLQVWGPQSLLLVFVLGEVSQQRHDFILKYFWGWFCFCKRRVGRKNCVSQSAFRQKGPETGNSGLGRAPRQTGTAPVLPLSTHSGLPA